jgi:hypothetical protein
VVSLFGVAYNWPLGAAVSVVMLGMTLLLLTLARKLEDRMNYAGTTGGKADGTTGGRADGRTGTAPASSGMGRGALHT